MPRHRTAHHTDGPGIGRKLKGPQLKQRLQTLAEEAINHHRQVKEGWQGWLEHARQVGEAFLEAKRRLGHRSKWSKWRYYTFIKEGIMSKETICVYMRIAREWEDPPARRCPQRRAHSRQHQQGPASAARRAVGGKDRGKATLEAAARRPPEAGPQSTVAGGERAQIL